MWTVVIVIVPPFFYLGISNISLRSLYKLARYLYEHQHYEEAGGAFYLLSLINPTHHIFWIGLSLEEMRKGVKSSHQFFAKPKLP
jgi:hypothetical protein